MNPVKTVRKGDRSITTTYVFEDQDYINNRGERAVPLLDVTVFHHKEMRGYVVRVDRAVRQGPVVSSVINFGIGDQYPEHIYPRSQFEPAARYSAKRLKEIHEDLSKDLEEMHGPVLNELFEWATTRHLRD